ncbi:MAG TPA: hypothetical protein VJM50_18275 [Pyrinomonadaceae bacterium]|nr:hypothetical protein [Pyrinomonadaceae bacterium]
MSTSTPETQIDDELIPRTSLPPVWVGFIFAVAFLITEFISLGFEDEQAFDTLLLLVLIGGWLFWIWCIHRIHTVLAELSNYRYPVQPGPAAVRHIFPLFNIYWIFYWPVKLSNYLNIRGRVSILSGYLIGAMLLLSLLLRFFDGALGMASLFGVTWYISNKVKMHVEAVTGVSPDELPPLPDPEIFSRPNETTNPTGDTVSQSRGRIIT